MNTPKWTKTCTCGSKVAQYGSGDTSCVRCGQDYNAFGERLRSGWDRNLSVYDEEVGDLEGLLEAW